MQLRMTAPMDIGMEQWDAALGGQDDIFDLDEGHKALRGKRAGAGYDDESDSEDMDEEDDDDDDALDSEEERERKVAGLEAELDGMYDAYQEQLKERDAKYKVKESLKNNKAREAWQGIQERDSDDEDSDMEQGGYDKAQRMKARVGEDDSDSSEDDDSSDEEMEAEGSRVAGKKRRRADGPAEGPSKSKKARTTAKLEPPQAGAPLSRSAQLWFDQDMFAGLDAEVEDEDEDEDEEEDSEMDEDGGEVVGEEEQSGAEVSSSLPKAGLTPTNIPRSGCIQ